MAHIDPVQLQITVTDELTRSLKALEEGLAEKRIRQIVREELAIWEKQQIQRARFGLPLHAEVK